MLHALYATLATLQNFEGTLPDGPPAIRLLMNQISCSVRTAARWSTRTSVFVVQRRELLSLPICLRYSSLGLENTKLRHLKKIFLASETPWRTCELCAMLPAVSVLHQAPCQGQESPWCRLRVMLVVCWTSSCPSRSIIMRATQKWQTSTLPLRALLGMGTSYVPLYTLDQRLTLGRVHACGLITWIRRR